jgi:hypothetical protein
MPLFLFTIYIPFTYAYILGLVSPHFRRYFVVLVVTLEYNRVVD